MNGHVSPRLKLRFEMGTNGLRLVRPDGEPFRTYLELARRVEQHRRLAEQERQRPEQKWQIAEQERQRPEQEWQIAEQERQRAEQATAEVERLRQRLRLLEQEPD